MEIITIEVIGIYILVPPLSNLISPGRFPSHESAPVHTIKPIIISTTPMMIMYTPAFEGIVLILTLNNQRALMIIILLLQV